MNNLSPIDYTHIPDDRELEQLVQELETTFKAKANMHRHEGLLWTPVERRIAEISTKTRDVIRSLNLMVKTQGLPDVVDFDQETGKFRFRDCSPESPEGRRFLAYDKTSEGEFREYYPKDRCDGNVLDTAKSMGIEVLDKAEYIAAQKVDNLDMKSSSYIKTPVNVREKGVAFIGDRGDLGLYVGETYPDIASARRGFRGALWV
jgi:hypothetical protein